MAHDGFLGDVSTESYARSTKTTICAGTSGLAEPKLASHARISAVDWYLYQVVVNLKCALCACIGSRRLKATQNQPRKAAQGRCERKGSNLVDATAGGAGPLPKSVQLT